MRITKIKLGHIVQSLSHRGMSNEEFAARLKDVGCRASASAVTKWLSLEWTQLPNPRALRAIKELAPDITIDWLLNVAGASTDAERTIEARMKNERL